MARRRVSEKRLSEVMSKVSRGLRLSASDRKVLSKIRKGKRKKRRGGR